MVKTESATTIMPRSMENQLKYYRSEKNVYFRYEVSLSSYSLPLYEGVISFDKDAGAIYIRLHHDRIARTVEANATVLLDISEDGRIAGIELLFADEDIIEALSKSLKV